MVEGDSHEDAVQRYFMKDQKIMRLYHATTQKKAKLYRQSGAIHAPVRGFTTMQSRKGPMTLTTPVCHACAAPSTQK